MKSIQDVLTAEQIERLRQLPEEVVDSHFSNPLYINTRRNMYRVQVDQIIKGAEKYPETLNSASWTAKEIVQHGREEAMDTFHYWEAAEEKFAAYEQEIAELKAEIARLKGE